MRVKDKVFVSANAPYLPPFHFLRSLYNLDNGRLRLRWDHRSSEWAVERQVVRPIEYIKSLPHYVKRKDGAVVENSSWVRARDGYILVGSLPAGFNPDAVIRNLQYYDIRRIGGAQEAELLLLRREEKERKHKDREFSRTNEAIAKDYWNSEVWRQGERIAVPKNYENNS